MTKELKEEQIGFRITKSLRDTINQFAKDEDRTEASAVCRLIKEGLKSFGYKVPNNPQARRHGII